MGLFDRITGKAKREEAAQAAEKQRIAEQQKAARAAKKAEKAAAKSTPKAAATAAGEPYIEILSISLEENDPGNGSFELDWNDIFVARLIKSGYQGKTDQDIVDNWFQDICRNVVLETYAQEQADPDVRNGNRRDLGNGRTEVS